MYDGDRETAGMRFSDPDGHLSVITGFSTISFILFRFRDYRLDKLKSACSVFRVVFHLQWLHLKLYFKNIVRLSHRTGGCPNSVYLSLSGFWRLLSRSCGHSISSANISMSRSIELSHREAQYSVALTFFQGTGSDWRETCRIRHVRTKENIASVRNSLDNSPLCYIHQTLFNSYTLMVSFEQHTTNARRSELSRNGCGLAA
jgi:hypothetical protein